MTSAGEGFNLALPEMEPVGPGEMGPARELCRCCCCGCVKPSEMLYVTLGRLNKLDLNLDFIKRHLPAVSSVNRSRTVTGRIHHWWVMTPV